MALKIRLTRRGTTNRPYYHIVVADSRAARDGAYLEKVGTYDPLATTDRIKLEGETIKSWIAKGAQPSERVAKMMAQAGLASAPKIAARPKKSTPKKKSQERADQKAEKAAALAEAAAAPKEAPAAEAPVAEEAAA